MQETFYRGVNYPSMNLFVLVLKQYSVCALNSAEAAEHCGYMPYVERQKLWEKIVYYANK